MNQRGFSMPLMLLMLALPGVASAAGYYGDGWYSRLETSVARVDNLSRAWMRTPSTSDTQASLALGLGYSKHLSGETRLELGGYLGATAHQEFDDLDHWTGLVSAQLDYEVDSDFDALWVTLQLEAGYRGYDESAPREGWLSSGAFVLNKRFTADITTRFGYRFTSFEPDDDAFDSPFETRRNALFLSADIGLARNLYLVPTLGIAEGQLASSSSMAPGHPDWYDRVVPDPAFAAGTAAYRLEADFAEFGLALVYTFGQFAVEVGGETIRAESEDGLTYRDTIVRCGLVWRF